MIFKNIIVKVNLRQYRNLTAYAKQRKMTKAKLIRKLMKPYLNGERVIFAQVKPDAKQMNLFEHELAEVPVLSLEPKKYTTLLPVTPDPDELPFL